MLPAIADPIRFLVMFTSTSACTVVFSKSVTIFAGITDSQTTDFPLPSTLEKKRKKYAWLHPKTENNATKNYFSTKKYILKNNVNIHVHVQKNI